MTVGYHMTEQEILARMCAYVIEHSTETSLQDLAKWSLVAIIKSRLLEGDAVSKLKLATVEDNRKEFPNLLLYTKLLDRHTDLVTVRYREGKFRLARPYHGSETSLSPLGAGARADLVPSDLFDPFRRFENDSVSAVLGIDVLRHLPLEDQTEFVRLCCEKLMPTGVLILQVADRECFYALAMACYLTAGQLGPVPQSLLNVLLPPVEVNNDPTPKNWFEGSKILDQVTSNDAFIIPESFVKLIATPTYVIYGYIVQSTMICRKLSCVAP